MTHFLALLPVLACLAMMFGAGGLVWLTRRSPLRRVSWVARGGRRIEPAKTGGRRG